ncbi:MAG: hypothetical protein HZC26_02295 [Candidatus Magasanikbacteria bacterium]|nr:hypothetical protein [Candidatus Magasanikbacteria bacterium]
MPNTFLYQPRYEDIKEVVNKYENFVINLGERIFHNVQLPSCVLVVVKQQGTNKYVKDLTRDKRELLVSRIYEAGAAPVKAIIKDTGITFDEVFLLKDAGVQYASVGAGKSGKGKSDLPQRIFSDHQDTIFDMPFIQVQIYQEMVGL